jgi:uncharacterized protein
MNHAIRRRLVEYLDARSDIAFAYLFGSAAEDREGLESDVDVAVYLHDPSLGPGDRQPLEVEEQKTYPGERELWREIEAIVNREVDLLVLNRAPATVAAAAVTEGTLLVEHDEDLKTRFMLAATLQAEDFRRDLEEFIAIRRRSQSLSEKDRARLLRISQYLRDELTDAHLYQNLDKREYLSDRHFRRAVERWVENLVNASIDIAKVVVASEKPPVPQTYYAIVSSLEGVPAFAHVAGDLAENTRLRNALAHEYLDMRYSEVARVAGRAEELYGGLADAVDTFRESSAETRSESHND